VPRRGKERGGGNCAKKKREGKREARGARHSDSRLFDGGRPSKSEKTRGREQKKKKKEKRKRKKEGEKGKSLLHEALPSFTILGYPPYSPRIF